jgi:DNA-binding beta-propeller fold protein YncE
MNAVLPGLLLLSCLVGCESSPPEETAAPEDSAAPVETRLPTVYLMERYLGDLFALDRETSELLWTLSGLNATVGVAVDAEGFIYLGVTDSDFVGSIVRVPPDGSAAEVLVPPDGTLLRPQGLWYDAATDTVLFADVNADLIYEMELDGFTLSVLTDKVPEPSDAARRPGEKTLYVTARGEGKVYVVTEDGTATALAASVPDAHSLVPGQDGVVYVLSTANKTLLEIDEATGVATTLASGFSTIGPVGLCIDHAAGGLLMTDHAGGTLFHYDFVTGEVTALFTSEDDVYECGHNDPPDADHDGFFAESHAGTDCDDRDASVHPGEGC